MSIVKNQDFRIVKGQDKLKIYQFHSKIAKHFFALFVEFIHIIIQELTQI